MWLRAVRANFESHFCSTNSDIMRRYLLFFFINFFYIYSMMFDECVLALLTYSGWLAFPRGVR